MIPGKPAAIAPTTPVFLMKSRRSKLSGPFFGVVMMSCLLRLALSNVESYQDSRLKRGSTMRPRGRIPRHDEPSFLDHPSVDARTAGHRLDAGHERETRRARAGQAP